MKAILAAKYSVFLLFFLASIAAADELYPIRVADTSPGPTTIIGAVVSIDQKAGHLTVTVKPTNLPTAGKSHES
jgi:hypothetical protein